MFGSGNFGGVYYVKKGRVHPVWRARVVVNGERHTQNFTTRIDAERWLEALRVQFSTNTFEIARAAERISFEEAAARNRKERVGLGATESEMKKLDTVLKHGGPLLDLPLAAVMPVHIKEYRDRRLAMPKQLKERRNEAALPPRAETYLNPKTVNKEVSSISVIFDHARVEWGFGTLINPTTGLRIEETDADIGKRVQPELLERLLAEGRRYEQTLGAKVRIVAYIELAILTTARLSALSKAKWEHLSPSGKTMEVPVANSKNGKRYSIILTARAREILNTLPRSGEYLFGGNPASISTAWNRVKRRAGVHRRLHDLRHEGTSWLFENAHKLGLTDHDISLVTSHRSAAAMKKYVHLKSASVVDRIDGNMKSEMQRFVEDLLVDGEDSSVQLAVAITRKRKELAARREKPDLVINGEAIAVSNPQSLMQA